MATENKFLNDQLRGIGSRLSSSGLASPVVAGNSTVKFQIIVPDGSWLDAVSIETPTAISGSPTSSLVRLGTTDGGVDIVAAVDAKSQGHIASTIVAAFDKIGGLVGFTILFGQVITSGGTASAGTINVRASYAAPVT